MGRKCSRIVTKTRIFVSWRAEEKWLNAMGAKGYRLADVDAFDYKFTVAAGKTFVYSLEWLDVSPLSDEGERFAAERERCPAVYGDRRSGRDILHRQFILNT